MDVPLPFTVPTSSNSKASLLLSIINTSLSVSDAVTHLQSTSLLDTVFASKEINSTGRGDACPIFNAKIPLEPNAVKLKIPAFGSKSTVPEKFPRV